MPTYRQNQPAKTLTIQKPLRFGKPAGEAGGAVSRTPAGPSTRAQAEGPLELGFSLDRSGSMHRLLDAAAQGFNAFVAEQAAAGPGFMSFNLFSDEVETVFAGLDLGQVEPIDRAFLARRSGSTALLDGIGLIIGSVAERWDRLPAPRQPALIAILTDGWENASEKFTKDQIFQMIHYRRSVHHWEFLFICSGLAGERYGLELGIQQANICQFETSPEGIKALLGRFSKASNAYRLGDRKFAGFLTDRTV